MKSRLIILTGLVCGFWLLLGALVVATPAWAGWRQNSPAAGGKTITVTTDLDDYSVDGNCSLREAIQAANTDTAVDACPAGNGADTIRLPRQVYSLTLTGSEGENGTNNAVADLDILDSVTLTPTSCVGAGCDVVPVIQAGAGWHHRLLQVTGPYSVTLANLEIRDADAPGLGGGLLNLSATVTLLHTTLFSNTAARGGGGASNQGGTLSLLDSTVQANTSPSAGGGISNTGQLFLSSSAVLSNSATTQGGGINNEGGAVDVLNSTVQSNTTPGIGAGLYNTGGLTLTDSLVLSNTAQGIAGAIYNAAGALKLVNTTIESNTATYTGGIDVRGGSLAMTGGALRGNSSTTPGQGTALDVDPSLTASLTNVDLSHNMPGSVNGAVRMASGAVLTITGSSLAANGEGVSDVQGRLNVVNSTLSGNGVAIDSFQGVVAVAGSTISGNVTSGNGAGLNLTGGVVTLTSSTLANNHASLGGGGVYAGGANLTLISSTVSSNSSAQEGGGISNNGGSLTILNSAILSNTSALSGGGIGADSTLTLTDSTVSGNTAGGNGGGIDVGPVSEANLSDDTIADNTADNEADGNGNGGGIDGGQTYLINTLIAGNVDKSPGTKDPDCGSDGELTSYGHNLIQNPAGCTIVGIVSSNLTGIDPKLGLLQNNGGPTLTQALLAGSPAIDRGTPTACLDVQAHALPTDQRGQPRPQGNACDIGAYESALAVVFRYLYLPIVRR